MGMGIEISRVLLPVGFSIDGGAVQLETSPDRAAGVVLVK